MVELMAALTVMAVLAFVVTPSLRDFLRNSRITSCVNDLLHSFYVARAEAIKRQVPVVVCAAASPTSANPACGGTFSGWIVFADNNRDGTFNAGDQLIEAHPLVDASLKISQDGTSRQTYLGTGFALAAGPANNPTRTIVVCDVRGNVATVSSGSSGNSTAGVVLISATGRAKSSHLIGDVTTGLAATGGAC